MSISASAPATRATRISSAWPAAQSSSAVLPTPASPRSTSTPLSPSRTAASTPSSAPVSTTRPSNALIPLPSSHEVRHHFILAVGIAGERGVLTVSCAGAFGLVLTGVRRHGVAEPVRETGRADAGVVAGDQGALIGDLQAVVGRVDIGHDAPRIVGRAQEALD